jgi:hypothetical protein
MEVERVPWLFAVFTAAWFGWMAKRAGRTSTLWISGGAAFGLVTSALVLGFGHARSIPFSDHDHKAGDAEWIIVAILLIAIIGWLLTSSLHRHHLLLWRKLRSEQAFGDSTINPIKPVHSSSNKSASGKAQP